MDKYGIKGEISEPATIYVMDGNMDKLAVKHFEAGEFEIFVKYTSDDITCVAIPDSSYTKADAFQAVPLALGSYQTRTEFQLISSYNHTLGLKPDGTVVGCGRNNYGQLNNINTWSNITDVAACSEFSIGLKSDGTLIHQGSTSYDIQNVELWSGIVAISNGGYVGHMIGLKEDGSAVGVGHNNYGQCNVGSWTDVIQTVTGADDSYGLRNDGTVIGSGRNYYHCISDAAGWTNIVKIAAGNSLLIGLKEDGTVVSSGNDGSGYGTSLTNIVDIAAGHSNAIVFLADNGTVYHEGHASYGQSQCEGWNDVIRLYNGSTAIFGLRLDGTVRTTNIVNATDYGQTNVGSWILRVPEV